MVKQKKHQKKKTRFDVNFDSRLEPLLQEVLEHKERVLRELEKFTFILGYRGLVHDDSKLLEPEKSMFDEYTPKLKEHDFGSEEYKVALKDMGEALKHHYENNRHHPEHFEFGIDDMNLYDVVEMFCDWVVASRTRGNKLDFDYLQSRFGMTDQLRSIFENTVKTL